MARPVGVSPPSDSAANLERVVRELVDAIELPDPVASKAEEFIGEFVAACERSSAQCPEFADLTNSDLAAIAGSVSKRNRKLRDLIFRLGRSLRSALIQNGLLAQVRPKRTVRNHERGVLPDAMSNARSFAVLREEIRATPSYCRNLSPSDRATLGIAWLIAFDFLLQAKHIQRLTRQTFPGSIVERDDGCFIQAEEHRLRVNPLSWLLVEPLRSEPGSWLTTSEHLQPSRSGDAIWTQVRQGLIDMGARPKALPATLNEVRNSALAWSYGRVDRALILHALGKVDSISSSCISCLSEDSVEASAPRATDSVAEVPRAMALLLAENSSASMGSADSYRVCMGAQEAIEKKEWARASELAESAGTSGLPLSAEFIAFSNRASQEGWLHRVTHRHETRRVREIGPIAYLMGEVFGSTRIAELDQELLAAGLEDVLLEASTAYRPEHCSGLIRAFEEHLRDQGAPRVVVWKLDGYQSRNKRVSAVWVDWTVIQRAYELLDDWLNPAQAQLAKDVTMLGYEGGLRRSEVVGLRAIDLEPGTQLALLIRGRVKTPRSRRYLPMRELASAESIARLEAIRANARTGEWDLFSPLLASLSASQWEMIFSAITNALQVASGCDEIAFRHLRHSVASRLLLQLLAREGETLPGSRFTVERAEACLPVNSILWSQVASGSWLWQIAALLGHSHPGITLRHYIHSLDIALFSQLLAQLDRPDAELIQHLTGCKRSTAYETYGHLIVGKPRGRRG